VNKNAKLTGIVEAPLPHAKVNRSLVHITTLKRYYKRGFVYPKDGDWFLTLAGARELGYDPYAPLLRRILNRIRYWFV